MHKLDWKARNQKMSNYEVVTKKKDLCAQQPKGRGQINWFSYI